jgi:hypothetical protein
MVITLTSTGQYEEAVGAMQNYESCIAYKNYTVWLHDKLSLNTVVTCNRIGDRR